MLDHRFPRSFSQFWSIMTKGNQIKQDTNSHLPGCGTFLLGSLAVLVPTSPASFPALRARPFGSTLPISWFRLPPHRPRPSRGRATPAVQTVGWRRSKEPKEPVRSPPGVQLPLWPPRLRPGASLARFRPRKCVWLHRSWKRMITHRWGWEVSYSSVSLWRYLLVPLAVHGKVGCSKHTLGKPSLKHWKAVWFFLRCATFPGKAKGLLNCYPPVRRLWCTGGWLGHWESRISWSSETSNHISLRFSFTEHETNPLFCFLISDIFL